MNNNCFVLYGPTASGKSRIAYELAEILPIEIINMDSVQVFKDFNIGSAKPDQGILKKVPHHLIDIVAVPEHFSVASYIEKLAICIKDVQKRNKIPLIVGGTMLYLKAIVEGGLSDIPPIDDHIRKNIHYMLQSLTQKQLFDLLLTVDPYWAMNIHHHDTQRTMRGLVVYFATNTCLSSYNKPSFKYNFNPKLIAIDDFDRDWLHQQISIRTNEMITLGLVDEVIGLIKKYPGNIDHFVFRSIGYKQVIDMINNNETLAVLNDKVTIATRQFAKRQITWMKHYQPDYIINPKSYSLKNIEEWLISHGN